MDPYAMMPQRDNQQSIVLQSLNQVATAMHHIDDLWLWLAQAVVTYFGVQIAQIWATQANQLGKIFPELRSMACQDASLPQNIVVNTFVRDVAQRLLHTGQSSPVQAVEAMLPQYLAILLKRHGLGYCANYFLSSPLLLPPANNGYLGGRIPTPLGIILIVFLQQYPSRDILPTIDVIFQQAIVIANQQALLLPAEANRGSIPGGVAMNFPQQPYGPNFPRVPQKSPNAPQASDVAKLIPHRNENPLDNPIAVGTAITDKRMRRLYAAIDDRTNIGDISKQVKIEMREVSRMLQILVTQGLVMIHEPSGRPVDASRLWYTEDF